MSKKNYNQRLKERWANKQKERNYEMQRAMDEFSKMYDSAQQMGEIIPVIFDRLSGR